MRWQSGKQKGVFEMQYYDELWKFEKIGLPPKPTVDEIVDLAIKGTDKEGNQVPEV